MRFLSEWALAYLRALLFPLVWLTEQEPMDAEGVPDCHYCGGSGTIPGKLGGFRCECTAAPRKPVIVRIIRNAASCKLCGDTVESENRHDLRACSCQAMFVDGGRDYLRRGGNPEFIEDLSETTRE